MKEAPGRVRWYDESELKRLSNWKEMWAYDF